MKKFLKKHGSKIVVVIVAIALLFLILGLAGVFKKHKPKPTPVPTPSGGDGSAGHWTNAQKKSFADKLNKKLGNSPITQITVSCMLPNVEANFSYAQANAKDFDPTNQQAAKIFGNCLGSKGHWAPELKTALIKMMTHDMGGVDCATCVVNKLEDDMDPVAMITDAGSKASTVITEKAITECKCIVSEPKDDDKDDQSAHSEPKDDQSAHIVPKD